MGPVERGLGSIRTVGKPLLHVVQRLLFGLVDCLLGGNHLFSGRHHDCLCRLIALGKAPDGEFERLKRGNIDIYNSSLMVRSRRRESIGIRPRDRFKLTMNLIAACAHFY